MLRNHSFRTLIWAILAMQAPNLSAQDGSSPQLADYFGFKPVEIFKLNERSANLLTADINQDGKIDIVSCDNSHSRLDFLQQRSQNSTAAPSLPATLNTFASDPRFEHVKLPLDKNVVSLTLGDFNRDGRVDIAFLGSPDRLIIRFQSEQKTWKRQLSLRLPDLQPAPWILASGDIDHDQQDDLALLGKKETFIFTRLNEKEIPQPLKLINTNDRPALIQINDLNGDSRQDLSYLANDDGHRGLCVRFQNAQGNLGPEHQFPLNSPRAIQFANVDNQPGEELLSIEAQTGRVQIHQFSGNPAEPGEGIGQLVQFGLPGLSSREQDLAVGDVDGDGRNDVVAVDPESAELILYPQTQITGLAHGEKFPTLMGGTQIRLVDCDQKTGDEILVLSPREKTIGMSRWIEGRLTFPKPLPVQGEPLLMETIRTGEPARTTLLYVAKSSGASEFLLQALQAQTGSGGEIEWKPVSLGTEMAVRLTLPKAPERLLIHRTNEKHLLIFYTSNEKPPHLFQLLPDFSVAPLPESEQQGVALLNSRLIQPALLDRPVFMIAQGSVARSIGYVEQKGWEIIEQYNATESGASIIGTVAIDLDGEPGPEIALIDQGTRKIRILRRHEGIYRPWKEVELGSFPALACQIADLNHDQRPDLILTGKGRFGVLYAGNQDLQLRELAVYETLLEDAYFQDITAGDLNHDGVVDLVLIDTQSSRVEIVSYFPGIGIRPAVSFKLFDSKHLNDRKNDAQEPRESAIADVTGDGLQDLILLTHDRLLLYPQDDGNPDPPSEKQTGSEKQANTEIQTGTSP